MHWVRTNISSIYYFTEIPIILKQHIQSDWITNELRKPCGDVLGTLSAHGYSKLWRTSFSMNKPTTWCKSRRVSLVSPSCLCKTKPDRALAQVCHTRLDALSLDEYQLHLLLHRNSHHSKATYPKWWNHLWTEKQWGDVLGTLSAHGYSKLWRTSFSMNKPTTWCKSGRVSLLSSSCLYKTQPERALAQVCHTRIDALSPDEYQFHLLLHRNSHHSQATYPKWLNH